MTGRDDPVMTPELTKTLLAAGNLYGPGRWFGGINPELRSAADTLTGMGLLDCSGPHARQYRVTRPGWQMVLELEETAAIAKTLAAQLHPRSMAVLRYLQATADLGWVRILQICTMVQDVMPTGDAIAVCQALVRNGLAESDPAAPAPVARYRLTLLGRATAELLAREA